MKTRRISAAARLDLLLALTLALVLALPVLVHLSPGLTQYAYAPYAFRILQPETVVEEAIPEYAGIRRTYTFTIPEGSASTIGARLSFYLRHTIARVTVEDSLFEYDSSENDAPHIGRTPGNYWISVPVRPAFAGKRVTVTLTPVFSGVREDIPVFWLIGREQLLTMILLPRDLLILGIGALTAVAGLLLSLSALILPLDRRGKRQLLCLGALSAAAGVWKLTGLESVVLLLDLTGRTKELWYLGAACYLVTLILSLRMLILFRREDAARTETVCFLIAAVTVLALCVLQLLGIVELHDTLIPFGLVAALLYLIALFSKKPTRQELLWHLPFLLALGLDFLAYRLRGTLHNAPVFLIWTLFSLIIRGFGFIRDALLQERLLRKREAELREARVGFLVSQIRPHFIYNSLISVYELCRTDPMRAREAIEDFNGYLMANFSGISASEPITFLDELRHTRAYLAVETMLHGENLRVDYDTPHTAFRLPALTLQPIVENSVKHGMGPNRQSERIIIRTRQRSGGSEIVVEDDGVGFDPASVADGAPHIGLQSIRDRLSMMCGGTLEVDSSPGRGTTVTVFIPNGERHAAEPSDGVHDI